MNAVIDDDEDAAAPPAEDAPSTSDRAALWVFVAFVVIALPLIVFSLGSYAWFLRDEWAFLAGRSLSVHDVLEPASGHWNSLPLIAYRVMYRLVGLRSYVPYQAMSVTLHLTAAVLLRVIMRRGGVRPWLATFAAALYVLFGPGAENFTWAFEIGYVGALVFGLTQLILADHDGPWDRRDWLGLGAGLLALTCSGIATSLVFSVGVAVLWRRGWRKAACHTVPLAVVYLVYAAVQQPGLSPFGRPPIGDAISWVARAERAVYEGLGHFALIGLAMAALLIVGWVIAFRSPSVTPLRERAAASGGLLIGGVFFAISTSFARWGFGTDAAAAGRYVHIYAALTLPALAFAAEAVVTRWRHMLVPVVLLLLLPIPWNATTFQDYTFQRDFFTNEKRLVLDAPRVPFATQVPRDVQLIQGPTMPDVTIGYLLSAQHAGKLPKPSGPVPEATVNELKVRLGVHQAGAPAPPAPCRVLTDPLDLSPRKGDVIRIRSRVSVATREGSERTSTRVQYYPGFGETLTIELDGLDLEFSPAFNEKTFEICV